MAAYRYRLWWSSFSLSLLLLLSLSLLLCCCRSHSDASTKKEKTLAMIKPDGLNYTDDFKRIVNDFGFSILRELTMQLDEDDVKLFYAEHSKRSFFPNLVKYMTSGPVFVMVLEKVNAVADWRALIGPTDARKAKITDPHSIRAMCGLDSQRNCVHGSDSLQSATREISFFFREIVSTGKGKNLPKLESDTSSEVPKGKENGKECLGKIY
ncbi:Nucleoside diphosphate kinase [Thalictrum thalictroides]|uniref:Nucleoside diphosphate kinase n=1 Tax=Thalictrum thalictroides TaxID=46969 RepID=A0A7J6V5X3_THATH|nr:Nucleoside diphosphate kinase [Thalictrum thalictroides]